MGVNSVHNTGENVSQILVTTKEATEPEGEEAPFGHPHVQATPSHARQRNRPSAEGLFTSDPLTASELQYTYCFNVLTFLQMSISLAS